MDGSTWWPLKEKESCIYRHEAFSHIANCPVYFSHASSSYGPEGFYLWRWCSSGLSGLWGECSCLWVTPVCQRLWGWWHLWLWAAASVHSPQCWWQQWIEWLLPWGGLQKGRGIINCFILLGLAEAANTCRAAKSAVTSQQAGPSAIIASSLHSWFFRI